MKTFRRIRSCYDYVAGGIACGLGGVLLIGFPFVAALLSWDVSHQWRKQLGLEDSPLVIWIWGHTVGYLGSLAHYLIGWVFVIAIPALGFVYGWWAGMHRPRNANDSADLRNQPRFTRRHNARGC